MKERPILFSGAMVQAILRADNPKTQTRRVVKPTQSSPKIPPLLMEPWLINGEQETDDDGLPCWVGYHHAYPTGEKWFSCPYGKAGDTLWVRETWCRLWFNQENDWQTFYAADDNLDYVREAARGQWKPSIHMFRRDSRISLRLTDVRVEQLQDISEEDAEAEGVQDSADHSHREWFARLWDGINGKKYPWSSNPWVWCLSFERVN
jgi:hypothetical protein